MNIAIMAHDNKKELMVQFCIAYCGILSEHSICATATTGRMVAEATGLPITLYLSAAQGGSQQIGARITYNEIDLVLFFADPSGNEFCLLPARSSPDVAPADLAEVLAPLTGGPA